MLIKMAADHGQWLNVFDVSPTHVISSIFRLNKQNISTVRGRSREET